MSQSSSQPDPQDPKTHAASGDSAAQSQRHNHPPVDVTEAESMEGAGAPESFSTRKRVLVAEDESLIRMDVVEMLEGEGYEVVGEAQNGQRAIDLARERRGTDLSSARPPTHA